MKRRRARKRPYRRMDVLARPLGLGGGVGEVLVRAREVSQDGRAECLARRLIVGRGGGGAVHGLLERHVVDVALGELRMHAQPELLAELWHRLARQLDALLDHGPLGAQPLRCWHGRRQGARGRRPA